MPEILWGRNAMSEEILIFGKDTWPYTIAAREAYEKKGKDVTYINVISDPGKMDSMLKYSKGDRKVPVIVEHGDVIIGFEGKGWRV